MGPTSSKSAKAGTDAKPADAAGQADADAKVATAQAEADAAVSAAQADADAKVAAARAEAEAAVAAAHAEADAKVAAAQPEAAAKPTAAVQADAGVGEIPPAALRRLKRVVVVEDQGASTERTIRLTPSDEVISWKDYGTHIVAVTADGQKFSTAA